MNYVRMYKKLGGEIERLLFVLWVVASSCQSAPLFNSKSSWHYDNGVPTIFTFSCDPVTGRCLQWLPIVDSRLSDYIVEQDSELDRAQLIQTRDVDKVSDSWRKATPEGVEVDNFGNQMTAGRLAKKDVFMSRGWGAGGMPFSVLYMSPRVNHSPPSGAAQVEVGKNVEPSRKNAELPRTRVNQSNFRVALRNGSSGQSRRHYSIIPQLFISYDWRPSGK